MERLTAFDGEFWIHKNFPPVEEDRVDEFIDCVKDLASRLATIENILGDDYDLERLNELVEADREGRCVVLPCKLHDKVFFVENGCVKETEVDSFHNWTSGHWKISTHTDRMFDHWKGYEIDFSGINKTVFLAREEAEAALERMREREK